MGYYPHVKIGPLYIYIKCIYLEYLDNDLVLKCGSVYCGNSIDSINRTQIKKSVSIGPAILSPDSLQKVMEEIMKRKAQTTLQFEGRRKSVLSDCLQMPT